MLSAKLILEGLKWIKSLTPLTQTRHCLLVVEDNADDACLLSIYIKRAGFDCDTVTRPELAEGMVLNGKHKVIFLDLNFSGMSGQDLMKSIARSRHDVHIILTPGAMKDLGMAMSGYWFSVIGKEVTQEEVSRALNGLKL